MEEKTMWELQWLFAVMLLAVTGYLGVIAYVLYRVRADIEQVVRSQRLHAERFDEIESLLRDMDFRLAGKASPSLQQTRLDADVNVASSDAWSHALKALDALEDDAAEVVIEHAFGARASREQHAERASDESAGREHSG
jgi:hypothetical protein